MGLVPWRAGAVRQAAAWAFARWIENRGGTESKEESQAIEAVRLMIEQFGQSRFETLDGDGQRVLNRLGWTKGVGPSQEWWIPSETWKVEICVGMDPKFVAATLGKNQMLGRSSDGWQMVKKIAGNNIRVYVVLASIFEGGTHGP